MVKKQRVLFNYTFSKTDRKALEFLVRTFTDREGVQITLFCSYLPLPGERPDFSKALGSWPAAIGEAILRNGIAKQLQEYENRLKETKRYLVEQGFRENAVDYIFRESSRDEATEIIEAVKEGGYDVVVLSFRPSGVRRIFSKNVYQTMMEALKEIVICVIT